MQKISEEMPDVQTQGGDSTFLTIITVILYAISRFSVTEWAGIATIIAASSTAILNIYRYMRERDQHKNKK